MDSFDYTISDGHGGSDTATVHVTVTSATTVVGAFVIGDVSAGSRTIGRNVIFWGAQWAKNNVFSGGDAPSAMKGFADSPTRIACGGTWTTHPGNSSNPPAKIPAEVNVIVSAKITKSGSSITGDIAQVVVARVAPGYQNDPGHTGTGQIIRIVC